jgi:hypothetical protein
MLGDGNELRFLLFVLVVRAVLWVLGWMLGELALLAPWLGCSVPWPTCSA